MDKSETYDNQEQSPSAPPPHTFWRIVADVQDRIALGFGVRPADREATVSGILARAPGETSGYWLQLLLAMGIATLGLVLGSSAVVIGAMLISPLMGPLVELGMGLAVGSPLLVLRSLTRTVASILAVVGCAALITIALPFQEVTAEIAARTSPTALDLLIAVLCAIAAAYTTIRPGTDTTGAAAGTAVGIALVPPLCVVGYGIGTRAQNISSGAALLFTANLCAILLFAVLCFLALGYSRAQAAASESAELERHGRGIIRKLTRGLRYLFGMKYGQLLRVLMPMVLLAVVAVPLSEALAQVTWQVRVRTAIQRLIASLPENTVRSTITVERDNVAVRLVTLGRADDASKLEKELTGRIAAIAGLVPQVHVIAVADSSALDAITAKIDAARAPLPAVAKTPTLDDARTELDRVLSDAWPHSGGTLLTTRLAFSPGVPIQLELVHLGSALGAAGTELLGERISRAMGSEVAIRDVVISSEPIVADPADSQAFLRLALPVLAHLNDAQGLFGCVEAPMNESQKPTKEMELVVNILRSLPAHEAKRLVVTEGERWRAVIKTEACTTKPITQNDEDAGVRDSGDASAL